MKTRTSEWCTPFVILDETSGSSFKYILSQPNLKEFELTTFATDKCTCGKGCPNGLWRVTERHADKLVLKRLR